MTDTLKLQSDEFDAMEKLAACWRSLSMTAVVDDDYPAVRHRWESALATFCAAMAANGRKLATGRPASGPARGLSFAALRQANVARLPLFKGNAGQMAHTEDDGSDWSLADWIVAVIGELGELANLAKKLRRGDFALDDQVPADVGSKEGVATYRDWLANEGADVAIYLDIFMYQLRRDLGEVVRRKFNRTSDKIGVKVKL